MFRPAPRLTSPVARRLFTGLGSAAELYEVEGRRPWIPTTAAGFPGSGQA